MTFVIWFIGACAAAVDGIALWRVFALKQRLKRSDILLLASQNLLAAYFVLDPLGERWRITRLCLAILVILVCAIYLVEALRTRKKMHAE